MPRSVEPLNKVRHLIDDPDIVLRIDANLLRKHETVTVRSDLMNEFAGFIELEQPRAPVRECAKASERNRRMARPGVNKNIAFRICRDAADFAQIDVIGER